MVLGTLDPLAELVGHSPAFERVLERLPALARSDDPVLLRGEKGAGKERIARAIHLLSRRAGAPFVTLRCASLTSNLLAEQVGGGTLYFDGIERLSPRAQVELMRRLRDRDVRVLAATSEVLEPLVESGRFRADLSERLHANVLELPPLRARREDILPLAEHFLRRHQVEGGETPRFSAQAIAALLAHDWPDNLRELESVTTKAARLAHEGTIAVESLGLTGESPFEPAVVEPQTPGTPRPTYRELKRRVLEAFDRQYLTELMTEHRGNVSRAARAAGKERRDLGKLLKRHGLDPRSFA
jgi:DNA-binding NtrC family response regulator